MGPGHPAPVHVSPKARLRRIGLVGHLGRASVRRAAARLHTSLARSGCDVRIESELAGVMGGPGRKGGPPGTPLADLARWCQLLVTLGGDGTTLLGGRALAGRRGALLPVNLGGLGFLTVAEAGEIGGAVRKAIEGKWPVRRRSMIRVAVTRGGRRIAGGRAMNDAVIKSGSGYTAVHLHVETLGADLGRLVADGLIAATATGSTAYSLSAGGPVLAPDVSALLVTPVCAHSLGTRSLVLDRRDALRVRVIGAMSAIMLLLDGQERIALEPGDQIDVTLAPDLLRVVENPDRPFARALRAKLGWQGSARRSF